jgi:transcriptional regulator with XRE-family HTH domain
MYGSINADPEPLAGVQLRHLRRLAGFSQPALERHAGLSAGRIANVEKGRASFRPWESAKVKLLLFEAMADRAREIAKHLPTGGSARTEGPASAEASSP